MDTRKNLMSEFNKKSNTLKKAIFLAAGTLAVFSMFTTIMITFTHQKTAPIIKKNQHKFLMQSLAAVMPIDSYDNDLITDSFTINHSLLSKDDSVIYPAYKNARPAGAIITTVAANGYNGKIKLIVGINYAGQIHAVRVVEHKETPGLGDPIEIKRSNWIEQFKGKSITNPRLAAWAVKKDKGQFDQLTGATITPRAVVTAVKNALLFYQEQQEIIFSQKSGLENND